MSNSYAVERRKIPKSYSEPITLSLKTHCPKQYKGRCSDHILSALRGCPCLLSCVEQRDIQKPCCTEKMSAPRGWALLGSPKSQSCPQLGRAQGSSPPHARVTNTAFCAAADTLWTFVNGP